MALCVALSCLA